jgi:hypothetical protein
MAAELVFPRVIYRGAEDPLGQGAGETKECKSAEDFEVDKKDGWRLERDPKHQAEKAKKDKDADADEPAEKHDAKGKK